MPPPPVGLIAGLFVFLALVVQFSLHKIDEGNVGVRIFHTIYLTLKKPFSDK